MTNERVTWVTRCISLYLPRLGVAPLSAVAVISGYYTSAQVRYLFCPYRVEYYQRHSIGLAVARSTSGLDLMQNNFGQVVYTLCRTVSIGMCQGVRGLCRVA